MWPAIKIFLRGRGRILNLGRTSARVKRFIMRVRGCYRRLNVGKYACLATLLILLYTGRFNTVMIGSKRRFRLGPLHKSRKGFLRQPDSKSCCLTDDGGIPLDLTLKARVFTKPNGFFIESGAQDGEFQSNTWVAEKYFGWVGLLVEPALSKQQLCVHKRPRSTCVHAGLVAQGGPKYLSDPGGDPMAGAVAGLDVKAYPLSTLLQNIGHDGTVQLWSLDIENGELDALRGVDYNLHRPKYILVEVWNRNKEVFELLDAAGYVLEPGINGRDDVSGWAHETTHRDFLWRDKSHTLVLLASYLHTHQYLNIADDISDRVFVRHVKGMLNHETWAKLVQDHDFVICQETSITYGGCIQEVLEAGSVPVILSSKRDRYFKGFPILILDSWTDLSVELLRDWQAQELEMEQINYKITT